MKRLLIALALASFAAVARGQDPMQEYIEAAKPVAEHKRLGDFTGDWKVVTRFWMDPAKPPIEIRGKGTGKWILGNRFVQLDTSATGGGVTQDSMTILGFDRRTSEYTMVGYDTMGTYYITAAGKHDPEKNAINLGGSYEQPPHGAEVKYRFVFNRDGGNHVMLLYFTMPDGKDIKVAETILSR